jgi:predicted ester cyclase
MFVERKKEDAGLFLREDFINNDPLMSKFADDKLTGIEGFQACFSWYDMVPNMCFTLDHVISGDDNVGAFWSWYGTSADGQKFLLHTVDLYRVQDAKIAEHWALWDFSQLKRFGMAPPQE